MNLGCLLLLLNLAPFEINFKESIAPLLVMNCIECHNSSVTKGNLNLETLAFALKGGDEGKAIVLGKPEESQLYLKIIEGENKKKPEMPRKKPALAKPDVEKIKAWIEQGAAWPKEIVLKEKAKADGSFWSFKPIIKVTPPVIKDAPDAWKINPIDAFVFLKLKEKGIRPSPVADKRTLIRRVSLDLIGLPPTSSEVEDFLNDRNPDAYERVVNRLLASPRYGERWARHWLDVARFSESDGFEEDMQRPLAYTFRDYVIGALNQDKPYDEFVREQIAGDVQAVQTGDSIAATGFLVAGPWDAVQRVTPSKLGRLQSREEQLEEIVSGVSQAFLGLTVQCARCHDHKFDPVSQEDYYRVKAVFEGVDHSLKIRAHGLRRLMGAKEESAWLEKTAPLRKEIAGLEARDLELQKQLKEKQKEAEALALLMKEKDQVKSGLEKLRQQLAKDFPVQMGFVGDREQPKPTVLFNRGDIKDPKNEVSPGGLQAIKLSQVDFSKDLNLPEAQRRILFAQWLTHPENPFTFRVMVNRLWQGHFGIGIVDTPSDFGFNGGRPTHPELLDFLAFEFKQQQYSIKAMHRLIVTSATYAQACIPNMNTRDEYKKAVAIDADNRLFWRFPSLRLEGEVVRDSMLAMGGNLNSEMNGPSFKPYTVTQLNTYFYHLFDKDENIYNRRTIYRMQVITGRSPLLDALDCPSPSITQPRRSPTSTPLQALALMNDSFVVRQSMKLAARLKEQQPDLQMQIELAYEFCYSRKPNVEELQAGLNVAKEHGLETLCWAIYNSSEFLYNH
ncbi:MAG: DUF1549 domain-containing protein [Planctomycetota bacterium]|nr:MAG: DUF1549 domain-containing protein [Planctomycetota bacterium]